MAEPLGTRLVRAGLVTRELLSAARAQSAHRGTGLAESLVACGLSEDALAGFMLASGHGPLIEGAMLTSAERALAERVGRTMADALLALPLRPSPDGVLVAMADPSDEYGVRELRSRLDRPVVPKVARVRELRAAISGALGPTPVERAAPAAAGRTLEIPLVRPRALARRAPAHAARPVPFLLPDTVVEDEGWGDLTIAPPPARAAAPVSRVDVSPPAARARFGAKVPPPGATAPPGDVGLFLADLRAAESRDEAVRIACEAGLTVGATAVFLGLRKGVLVGWEGLGPGSSREALRTLWIPATSASVFKRVLETGRPHHGPHGAAAADQLFRAATGCRGAKLAVHAVHLRGKPSGLLCVDDPRYADEGEERLAVVSHALGEALKRLVLAQKL